MPPSRQSEGTSNFWHCGRCGTPNPPSVHLRQCLGCGDPRPRRANPAGPPKEAQRGRGGAILWTSWGYAAIVLGAIGLVRSLAESWWPATFLLFLPRMVFLAPLPLLALWAARAGRRRLWALHLATALVVVGPLMGFAIPWARLSAAPSGERLRILTFNTGEGAFDVPRLIELIERERVDVVCLQEQEARPTPALGAYFTGAWRMDSTRSVASRLPIVAELDPTDDPFPGAEFYPVRVKRLRLRGRSGREFLLADVHMPTPSYGLRMAARGQFDRSRRYSDWRWRQLTRLVEKLAQAGDLPTLLGGDFNMPSDSPMFAALRPRFDSAFEEAGWGFGYTKPTAPPWIRIDHVLATPEWAFARCWVGPDLGSDHLPVIAEVVLRDGG